MPAIKGKKIPRFPESIKAEVIKAIADGHRVYDLAVKYGIKRQTIYGFLYCKGLKMRKFKQERTKAVVTSKVTYAEKLRLISFYCECDQNDAINACVEFYFKHLQSIVTSKIKGA